VLYLLDTNVIVIYLNQRSLVLRERLEAKAPEDIAVCSAVKFELFYGAMRSADPPRNLARQREFLNLFVSLRKAIACGARNPVGKKPGFSGGRNPVGKKPGFDSWEKTLITETRLAKNRVSTVGEKTGFRQLGKNRVSYIGLFAHQKPGFFEKPGFLDVSTARNPVGKKPGLSVGPETRLAKNRVSVGPETRLGKNRVSVGPETRLAKNRVSTVGEKTGFRRLGKNLVSSVGEKTGFLI
jgi:hypothetical protein